jgi:serine phosphatase RsbU (regulator of sigma subunit)
MESNVKAHNRVPRLVLIGFSLFMFAVCLISFAKAISWINKPFAGFLIYHPPYGGSISVIDWPGKQAGLKFLERIVSVDDRPVEKGQDVVDRVRELRAGTPVHYKVESKGHIRDVIIPTTIFDIKDFFLAFFVTFLGGIILFCLGVIVVLFKPTASTSWIFFGMCFTLSSYMITSFEILSTYQLVRFHYSVLSIFPITFFHLGLTFPDRKRILTRFPTLEYLIYVPGIVLILGYQVYFSSFTEILSSNSLSWVPSYKLLGSMARLFMLFSVLSLIVFVFVSYFRASTITTRQRARMIVFGVTIAFLPSLVLTLLSFFLKFYFPWNFLVFFIIFFPASIAYSIVRHNLFDADAIIKRTVGYAIFTVLVVGAYAGIGLVLNVVAGKYQVAQSRAFPILFTLGVILVFNPLRNRIQALVDRVFFRKEYDYGEIIEKIGGAITSLLELPQILKRLTQTFIEDMFVNTSSVMLLNPAGTAYQVYLADGEKKQDVEKIAIKRDQPLMEIVEGEKRELTKNDMLEDPKYRAVSETCAASFDALHASLMVPLVFQDQVIGSLNLGEKKSGKLYNRADIELLHTLANQGAVAIENARLFQENLEKQRMEEELNIARDLQMSMLPAACPEIERFKIAASSTPAREVGGDFYDFIEMGADRVGFVIGDVTGKSVSGALVMSSSRSVFRMLSEEQLTVGDIMMRANRRIKKDITSGMFVALLYAVLNSRERILSLCSAGQTQPIHLSAKTGEAMLVQTEGDTFPLGILEDAKYQETRLQLAPGDRVVFYTDGIVEAMNKQEEMFGFERLMEVVQGARSLSADLLLKEIIARVNEFADGVVQHDDLTVIVVSVAA